MQIPLARSAYRRDRGSLAEFRLVNMFAEATPADEKGVILQSRPGLSSLYTIGTGPIAGMFAKSGVLSGDLFAVSDLTLYRGEASLGAVTGTGPASWAASASQVALTLGGTLYVTEGVTVAAVAFPDSASVAAIAHLGGYFYGVRDDTHRLYFSALLDGDDWQALDFLSAERKPDPLYDILNLGEELAAMGAESVEFFQETGDPDAPIARAVGRTLDIGILATGCGAVIDGSLVWIANDHSVRTYDGGARRLSDASIDARIKASATVSTFGFSWEGHVFFVIRLATETLVVDAATREWCEFSSLGYDNWRATCVATTSAGLRFGDSESGAIAEFAGEEDYGEPMERIFTAAAPLDGPITIHNVEVAVNVGRTALLTGQGSDPRMEIRASNDAGATFAKWRPVSIGRTGKHRARVRINRWGMFDSPGVLFEGRMTDPVPFRVSDFEANMKGGGRAR